jgi:hypothetical protein
LLLLCAGPDMAVDILQPYVRGTANESFRDR